MQTSTSLPSWNVIEQYAGMVKLAAQNADPANWEWNDRSVWKLATKNWQGFKTKWYGTSQCASLVDPKSTPLSLDPLTRFDGAPPSILVRKSYLTTFDHVWAQAMSSEGEVGTIITGQPGIGKTMFQYYILVRLLQHKQIVLFTMDGEHLWLFYHDGVYMTTTASLVGVQPAEQLPVPKLLSSEVFLWSLFEIEGRNEPETFLVKRPCMPVQTASLGPSQYRTWEKERTPLLTGLPLWTHDELMQGFPYQENYQSLLDALREGYASPAQKERDPLDVFPGARAVLKECEEDAVLSEDSVLLSPEDALHYLLEAAIDRFGYSAHDVFSAVFDYNSSTQCHQEAFRITYTDFEAAASALPNNQNADHNISHWILALWPVDSAPFVRIRWEVKFKSKWVGKNVIQQMSAVEDDALRHQIRILQRNPKAVSLTGQFLEPFVHDSIANSTGSFWPLINMASNNADPPLFTMLRDSVSSGVQFPKIKREIVKFHSVAGLSMENNIYYIPADTNFPLFDSFTVDINHSTKSAVLWVLQITTSRLHAGSARGYLKIRSIIANLKSQLRGDPPPKKTTKVAAGQASSTPHVRVCYLLVVPQGDYEPQTQWDFPKGWNENCDRHDHRGNVYCLEVPVGACSQGRTEF